jgi:hypothetical protein
VRSASERVRFQYAHVSSGVAYKYLIQGFIQSPPRTGSIKTCQNKNLSTGLCFRTPWTDYKYFRKGNVTRTCDLLQYITSTASLPNVHLPKINNFPVFYIKNGSSFVLSVSNCERYANRSKHCFCLNIKCICYLWPKL